MPVESAVAQDAIDNQNAIPRKNPVGSWEIHSWGDGKSAGMAAMSAITTLQIGATLTPIPEDQIALNKAAEYLMDALASQLQPFQRAVAADCSNEKCLESR